MLIQFFTLYKIYLLLQRYEKIQCLCRQITANYQGIKWFCYLERTAKKSKRDYLNKTVPFGLVRLYFTQR